MIKLAANLVLLIVLIVEPLLTTLQSHLSMKPSKRWLMRKGSRRIVLRNNKTWNLTIKMPVTSKASINRRRPCWLMTYLY